MGNQPAASTLDFLLAYQIGAPVARAPARAEARATCSVGILSPDFFLVHPVVAPVAWASAHAGGRIAYHVRQVGGPAAAGPRFFVLCGHGVGAAGGRVEGRRRRPLSGQPDRREGKRIGGRADAAAYATPIRAVRGPEPKARGGPGGRVSGRRGQGCRLCRPRPRKRA